MSTENHVLYKIYTRVEWRTDGPLPITQLDQRSGFVHLSSSSQIDRTLELYFTEVEHVIVGFNRSDLGEQLVYETVPTREVRMPHFYGDLRREWICSVTKSWSSLETKKAKIQKDAEQKE